jgi:hypothetical protein
MSHRDLHAVGAYTKENRQPTTLAGVVTSPRWQFPFAPVLGLSGAASHRSANPEPVARHSFPLFIIYQGCRTFYAGNRDLRLESFNRILIVRTISASPPTPTVWLLRDEVPYQTSVLLLLLLLLLLLYIFTARAVSLHLMQQLVPN